MEVEWLILADAAQMVGNKLYLLGGGWDRLTVNTKPPLMHSMAVAASFRVPWNDTNQKHSFDIEIATSDGESIGKVSGQFEVGRPPGMPTGRDQRAQIAVNVVLQFKQLGDYVVISRINGTGDTQFPFSLVPGAAGLMAPQQSG